MRQILKKIPITIWTIILIIICSSILTNNLVDINVVKLDTLTKILTIVGLYFLAVQVKNQTNAEKISNEFLNQSNFFFTGFNTDEIDRGWPALCSEPGTINYNKCSDIHWFNMKQIGNLPAKDISISLFHEDEKKDILNLIKNRTLEEAMIYKEHKHQFKLGQQAIPITFLNPKQNGAFYILLEYRSVYTKIKYKRIYELGYSPSISPNETPITWIKSISYHNLKLVHFTDTETLTIKEVFKNKWNKLIIWLNIKKTLDIHEWLIDL